MEYNGNNQLPVGFGMSLAMDVKAMSSFSSLPDTKKEQLVQYITSSNTGYEAKDRIVEVVNQLHNDSFH